MVPATYRPASSGLVELNDLLRSARPGMTITGFKQHGA